MKTHLSLLLVTFFAAGCSQLRVNVSIFDVKEFEKQEEFSEAVATTQYNRIAPAVASGRLENLKESYVSRYTHLVQTAATTRPSESGPFPVAGEDAPKLATAFATEISGAFDTAQAYYSSGINEVWLARSHPRGARRDEYKARATAFLTARSDFDRGDLALLNLRIKLASVATTLRADPSIGRKGAQAVTRLQRDITTTVDTYIARNGIVEDPYASVVVAAPEQFWRGTFNQTYGLGTFGNTDVAVKMDSLANFTLKGVRNDTSKITPAIFLGLQQAIHLAADAYGVPLPPPNRATPPVTDASTGNDTAGSGASDTSTTAASVKEDSQLAVIRSRAAALVVLQAIVGERSTLASPPMPDTPAARTARAASLTNIKAALEAAKDDLEMDKKE